jgi:DNA-binding NarL/FixJ family response regulator
LKEGRMEEKLKFLIVDDHPIFRHGLRALIETDPRYRVYAEAGSIPEALEIIEREPPDMLLLDISLGAHNGLDLLKALRSDSRPIRALVISIHDEAVYAERALRANARGYLMKHEASSVLKLAISEILDGKIFVSAPFRERLLERACRARNEYLRSNAAHLSDRELEVLKYMGQGYGATEIAGSLSIAVKTVGVYQDHIKKKLSLQSIPELRKYAIEWMQGP